MFTSSIFSRTRAQQFAFQSFLLAALVLATVGCDASINKSIRIADGESVSGGLTSVNGSITIGNDANIGGDAQTVNGRIRVGDASKVGSLATVNGRIEVGGKTHVDGDVESVNGSVECGAGSTVEGDIETVNGRVTLEGTEVKGAVETRNGSVILSDGARISRDVRIESVRNFGKNGGLEIRLTGGSVIEGDVIIEDQGRKVTVSVDETSEIKGKVQGAEIAKI